MIHHIVATKRKSTDSRHYQVAGYCDILSITVRSRTDEIETFTSDEYDIVVTEVPEPLRGVAL